MFDFIIAIVALIWLIAASISDLKTKEVPNWLNFSLIAIAFGIFTFKSLEQGSFKPLIGSLTGFGIFFIIGSLMYYSKQWGGGDAKLLYGLGALLHEYPAELTKLFNPNLNIPFLAIIFLNLIIIGSLYGLVVGLILIIKNRKKFVKQFKKLNSKIKTITTTLATILFLILIIDFLFIQDTITRILLALAGIFPLIFIYLYISAKAIEDIHMYRKIKTEKLVEGDWIVEAIKVNNKLHYNPKKSLGVTKKQIEIIKKHKKEVIVKEGIAFVPPFLLATIISLIFGNWLF